MPSFVEQASQINTELLRAKAQSCYVVQVLLQLFLAPLQDFQSLQSLHT